MGKETEIPKSGDIWTTLREGYIFPRDLDRQG